MQEIPAASLCSLERLVRRVTSESGERDQTAHRRGNDGRCRRERLTGADDDLERQTATTARTGTDAVLEANENRHDLTNQSGEEERLTYPSSATGYGDARLDNEKRRAAMACSLERVVRPAPTEGALDCRNSGEVAGASGRPIGRQSGRPEPPDDLMVRVFAILRLRMTRMRAFSQSGGSGRPECPPTGRPETPRGQNVHQQVVRRLREACWWTFWSSEEKSWPEGGPSARPERAWHRSCR